MVWPLLRSFSAELFQHSNRVMLYRYAAHTRAARTYAHTPIHVHSVVACTRAARTYAHTPIHVHSVVACTRAHTVWQQRLAHCRVCTMCEHAFWQNNASSQNKRSHGITQRGEQAQPCHHATRRTSAAMASHNTENKRSRAITQHGESGTMRQAGHRCTRAAAAMTACKSISM